MNAREIQDAEEACFEQVKQRYASASTREGFTTMVAALTGVVIVGGFDDEQCIACLRAAADFMEIQHLMAKARSTMD